MSTLQVTGKLIEKGATMQVSERFKKREFTLDITEEVNGQSYPNFAKMQAVQNRCEILDKFNEGDEVTVSFNIRGNRWEKDGKVNYIVSLDAWRIEKAQSHQAAPSQPQHPQPSNTSSQDAVDSALPF